MQPFPPRPGDRPKAGDARRDARPIFRTPVDPVSPLFNTGNHPTVNDPIAATKRSDRGSRILGDVRRALFFAVVLVFVAIVLYQFVSATAL